jgi:hypothetical protein
MSDIEYIPVPPEVLQPHPKTSKATFSPIVKLVGTATVYICPVCEKQSRSANTFSKHMRSATKRTPPACLKRPPGTPATGRPPKRARPKSASAESYSQDSHSDSDSASGPPLKRIRLDLESESGSKSPTRSAQRPSLPVDPLPTESLVAVSGRMWAQILDKYRAKVREVHYKRVRSYERHLIEEKEQRKDADAANVKTLAALERTNTELSEMDEKLAAVMRTKELEETTHRKVAEGFDAQLKAFENRELTYEEKVRKAEIRARQDDSFLALVRHRSALEQKIKVLQEQKEGLGAKYRELQAFLVPRPVSTLEQGLEVERAAYKGFEERIHVAQTWFGATDTTGFEMEVHMSDD